ncbi:MAG: hypothetical protein JO257_34065 [Deltaproteobacteria bacterium]|nr:hypothetical protein [Deltaproteobacteria bacterium]
MRPWLELVPLLNRAVEPVPDGAGLHGVAVLSPSGEPVGVAGALAHYEVRALAALVSREGPPDLLRTLFEGELAAATFDDRRVFLGIAGRCVFVIAMAGEDLAQSRAAAADLRDDIERLIREARLERGASWIPPTGGSEGSGSPAEAFAWPPRPRPPNDKN